MEQVMTVPSPASGLSHTPWWKVPQMWLVVGGPAAVIVAGIATAVIAVRNPDPVLNKAEYERDLAAAQKLEGEARAQALAKMQPAHQARNHAASPVVTEPGK